MTTDTIAAICQQIPTVTRDDAADMNPIRVAWPDGTETGYPDERIAAGAIRALRFRAFSCNSCDINRHAMVCAGLDMI